jgi:hypothetical protein
LIETYREVHAVSLPSSIEATPKKKHDRKMLPLRQCKSTLVGAEHFVLHNQCFVLY